MTKTMLNIEAPNPGKSAKIALKQIMIILNSSADQKTKRLALKVLSKSLQIKPASTVITNCVFSNSQTEDNVTATKTHVGVDDEGYKVVDFSQDRI